VTEYVNGSGTYKATFVNTGINTFSSYGALLLVVYESIDSPKIEYWINEGSDILYAKYGVTPDNATTRAYFGSVDLNLAKNATLITVVTGGDKGLNTLFFNNASWSGVYNKSGIGIDQKEVTNNLVSLDNHARIQDSGDYLTATNAILMVEMEEGVKGDFNENGRVDIGDAAYVAYMVVGKVPVDLSADFNGNGRVDIGDATKIAYYVVGKISKL
ncbi:MAG TPA: DUF3344 domain-containing protein, partial [Methanosarcinales archaeon]|nr:DUF3344 domain-containing protein [Methanosarcinales archaeon]